MRQEPEVDPRPEPRRFGASIRTGAGQSTVDRGRDRGSAALQGEGSVEHRPRPIKKRTEHGYRLNLRTLYRFSENRRRLNGDVDRSDEVVVITLTEVVGDFLPREDLTAGTYKTYRAALLWHARDLALTGLTEGIRCEAQELVPILEATRQSAGRPKEDTGPTWIPEEDYDALNNELMRRGHAGSIWADRAHVWLMAGVITGLRPGEWADAGWHRDKPATLEVVCGKVKLFEPAFIRKRIAAEQEAALKLALTTERVMREIPIGRKFDWTVVDTQLQYVDQWLRSWPMERHSRRSGRPPTKTARGMGQLARAPLPPRVELTEQQIDDAFQAYYMSVRDVIRRACVYLWEREKMYSLYSCRHQFSANMRAAIGPAETSKLMGHGSPDSSSSGHYASRHGAHGRHRSAGAERIANRGPEMDAQLREQLAQRRRAGPGQSPEDHEGGDSDVEGKGA